MKSSGRRRLWKLAAAFFLFVLVGGAIYFFWPRGPTVPASVLFPPHSSVEFRFKNFGHAFDLHWESRGQNSTDQSMERLLDYAGVWDDWSSEYGEADARKRIAEYRKAFFFLLGKETWLVLGHWDVAGKNSEPATALLAISRADSPIKTQIGPLAELIFSTHAVQTSVYRDIKIYHYLSDQSREAMSLANVGGWICAVMESSVSDVLPRIIDQVHAEQQNVRARSSATPKGSNVNSRGWSEAKPPVEVSQKRLNPEGVQQEFGGALSGTLRPGLILEDRKRLAGVEKENEEEKENYRKRRKSKRKKKEEIGLDAWLKPLEEIEEIQFQQTGNSLLDLDLRLRSKRIASEEAAFAAIPTLAVLTLDYPTTPSEKLSPSILQMDLAQSFAVKGASLVGIDWDALIERSWDFDWIRPNWTDKFKKALESQDSSSNGRIGWALYPTLAEAVPVAAVWSDRSPLLRVAHSPADAWRMIELKTDGNAEDSFETFGVADYRGSTTPPLARAKRDLVDRLWSEGDSPPLAFVSVHFDDLAESMRAFPAIVLKKQNRKDWLDFCSLAEGLDLAFGSVALRLDRKGDELVLETRTLEKPSIRR